EDTVDAEFPANLVRHGLGVAGDHNDLDAELMEGVDGVAGLGPDLVGEREAADYLAVAEDVQDDRTLGPPRVGRVDLVLPGLLEQPWTADANLLVAHGRGDADCRGGGEPTGRLEGEALLLGGGDYGPGERVLAVGLGRGGQGEHLVGVQAAGPFPAGEGDRKRVA